MQLAFAQRTWQRSTAYLGDVDVRLHDKEWIKCIGAARVRVVEEVPDLSERGLAEVRAAQFRGYVTWAEDVLETKSLRRVRKRTHDARVERLNFLEPGSEELALRRRPLVNADAHEDFAEQRKDARDVVEARHNRSLPVWLRQVRRVGDAGNAEQKHNPGRDRATSVPVRVHELTLSSAGTGMRQGENERGREGRRWEAQRPRDTHYSSSSSLGKLHVVSSSRREMGRPSRIDIDLSAVCQIPSTQLRVV